MSRAIVVLAALFLTAVPADARPTERTAFAERMKSLGMPVLDGKELERAVAAAEAYPLGSRENPVRVDGPMGERAYLERLVCDNGSPPQIGMRVNVGPGLYGTILDLYPLSCGENTPAANIHMDMYFRGTEDRPPPGFSIGSEPAPAPVDPDSSAAPTA